MGPTTRADRIIALFRNTCLLLGFLAAPAPAATLVREFRYPAERVALRWRGDSVAVSMPGALREGKPGRPDLPVIAERLDLPAGSRVRAVSVAEVERAPLAALARVRPTASMIPGAPPAQPAPDWETPAPEVELGQQGSMRGRRVAWLLVRPVRWDARSGRMERLARLQVKVDLESDTTSDVVPRERIVRTWESDPPDPSDPRVVSATSTALRAQPFKATQIPSILGSPVAYVIVTSDALASEFQRLADWKTQAGVPAVVRTVSFIRQQYPDGVDDADKIRRFIRDAYSRWGTAWVLLGGDPSQVPVRLAYSTFCGTPGCLADVVSDDYFACLDGNWNGDGDLYYGEGQSSGTGTGGDNCDLLPDVYVGRAPVTTAAEAHRFVDRTFQYERTPTGDYENQVLFFSEVLFPEDWAPGDPITLDGASYSEAVLPSVQTNAAMRYGRLYQNYTDPNWQPGALPESRQAVIDSLNTGYNVAMHVGHGFRDVASCGDANLTSQDAVGLTNGNRLSNTYMGNCTSNAIDLPCLGRAMMSAPNGGSVTNIGSTRLDYPAVGSVIWQEYFRLVFETHTTAVGEAQAKQMLPLIPYAAPDNAYRWMIMTTLLLGDPELRIWTSRPKTLTVTYPASIPADQTSLNVTVTAGGSPVAGALVTAYKVNDDYRSATTNSSGQVTLPFRPDATGSFTLTVTGYDCKPFQATVPITAATAPVLAEQPITVDDDTVGGTNGNNNQIIEAGETVDVRVPLMNNGGTTASSVTATLTTTDPLVNLITGSGSYGSIAVGATATGPAFRFSTPLTAPDQREIPFTLTAQDAASRTYVQTFQVTLRSPEMRHVSHTVTEIVGNSNGRPEVGETVDYAVRLRNTGTGSASGVTAILRDHDGLVTITDSTATFGTIAPGVEVTGDAFRFTVLGAGAVLELRISTQFGLLATQNLDLGWPATPAGLAAAPGQGSIKLTWTPNSEPDLAGYLVYRSIFSGGPYTQVTPLPTDRTSYAVDTGLAPLTRYFYKIAAVDSSANISAQTPFAVSYTNPAYHAPFPLQLGPSGWNSEASVAVARIHQAGKMDILAGADVLYDLNSDGTAPVDADGLASTVGDFTTQGKNYAAGPTIADVDGGGLDVLGATWDTKKLFLFDAQGQVKTGWPFTALDPIFSTPAVWDLDGDGKKEIVFGSNGPYLYALRYNGAEWMDGDGNPATTGVFKVLGSSFNYGTPAIADVDGNGQPDIVYGGADGNLYAWRPNGTSLPGFPIPLGGPVYGSVALGFLDGAADQQMDIVVAAGAPVDSMYVFLANGGRRPGFPVPLKTSGGFAKAPSPALADMNGDGYLDIVAAGTDGLLKVFDRNGALLPAFANVRYSVLTDAATECSPVVADINGDGSPDIVIGDDLGVLSAYDSSGLPLAGFPIQVPGEVKGTPALCDCDGDGMTEIVLVGWDSRLYVWDYDYPFSPSTTPPWPQFHHDAMHTGFASASTVLLDAPIAAPPLALRLIAPAPNPATDGVRLGYEIPASLAGQALSLDVFDLAGRRIRHLAGGAATTGRFPLRWDLRGAGSARAHPGVYLVRLEVGRTRKTQRVVVLP